jgi:hypothetical protein
VSARGTPAHEATRASERCTSAWPGHARRHRAAGEDRRWRSPPRPEGRRRRRTEVAASSFRNAALFASRAPSSRAALGESSRRERRRGAEGAGRSSGTSLTDVPRSASRGASSRAAARSESSRPPHRERSAARGERAATAARHSGMRHSPLRASLIERSPPG